MPKPRDLNPSAIALRRRAERARGAAQAPPHAPRPKGHHDSPDIKSSSSTEEAVRLRAVYDARKSRLSSMAEGLRLEQERGKLWTSAQVRARDEKWNAATDDRLDMVERLLDGIDAVTPEQRRAFLDAARAWRLETKRTLAAIHA